MSASKREDPRTTEKLLHAALGSEGEDGYWTAVTILWFRGTQEVFEAARELLASDQAENRALGADVLSQLGTPSMPFVHESVTGLLDLLSKEKHPVVLHSIGVALGHLKDPRAIEPLIRLKAHPDGDVRFGVVYGLLGWENQGAVDALIELCSDADTEVRNWATFGLGSLIDGDTPEVREALLRGVDDEDAEIRGEALVGLARRKDERVIEPLIRELEAIPQASEWWDHLLEAAAELADSRLCPALLGLRGEVGGKECGLEEAIAACQCGGRDGSA